MFLGQQVIILEMISEGSCDTEHWSNDAENVTLITGINYILHLHLLILADAFIQSDLQMRTINEQ